MRIRIELITEPIDDLTLTEKFACAVQCGSSWYDGAEVVARGPAGMPPITEMGMIECPVQGTDDSIYIVMSHADAH